MYAIKLQNVTQRLFFTDYCEEARRLFGDIVRNDPYALAHTLFIKTDQPE
jgi:hypothetical protein